MQFSVPIRAGLVFLILLENCFFKQLFRKQMMKNITHCHWLLHKFLWSMSYLHIAETSDFLPKSGQQTPVLVS